MQPLLLRKNLDPLVLSNVRLISKFTFISKVLHWANIGELFQIGFKPLYSIEAVLLHFLKCWHRCHFITTRSHSSVRHTRPLGSLVTPWALCGHQRFCSWLDEVTSLWYGLFCPVRAVFIFSSPSDTWSPPGVSFWPFTILIVYSTPGFYELNHLQLVQSAAARPWTGTKKREHITPVLSALHCFPVSYRIH